ncbi:MAG: GlsB/YeaQ/YmgE family stress response membrane protein [Halioglobus sp.]|nr:GlsB/YeaQ/YmgE family stress response membrane protein [Halioglobus sp.]
MEILIVLAIGAVAGWLGSVIMTGQGFGLLANIVIGIVGSLIGSWLLGLVGIYDEGSLLGTILTATFGAVVLLFVVGLIKKA